ncbi:MAG: hypothetical protein U9R25_20385 [Chloroflexota bacterium]|nr:hypothetical protein [Chloroflexota bacterium]
MDQFQLHILSDNLRFSFVVSFRPAGHFLINELGTPGQTHEVLATLLGPAAGLAPVGGRTIEFEISAGPNAPAADNGATDAGGVASYEYTAVQGPAGLGTDTIEACVTLNDPLGETGCTDVTKDWVDTTPPDAFCTPTVNPHGNNNPNAPGQGGQGQNQDGFYEMTAEDLVWPPEDLEMFVTDTGSGTVFGPYPVGTKIKYTEDSNATPIAKLMGGQGQGNQAHAIDWHIIGNGDAAVTAVAGSGNMSVPAACLVPPPPM